MGLLMDPGCFNTKREREREKEKEKEKETDRQKSDFALKPHKYMSDPH